MEQNSTPIQLIKFLYRETSPTETIDMMKALAKSQDLQQELQELKKACRELPKVKFKPAKKTINSILSYNRQFCLCR